VQLKPENLANLGSAETFRHNGSDGSTTGGKRCAMRTGENA